MRITLSKKKKKNLSVWSGYAAEAFWERYVQDDVFWHCVWPFFFFFFRKQGVKADIEGCTYMVTEWEKKNPTSNLFSNKSRLQTEAAITKMFWCLLEDVIICVASFIKIDSYFY